MLAADTYESLGALLSDALIQWKREVALLELDRKKLKHAWTYRECIPEVARVAGYLARTLPATNRGRDRSTEAPLAPIAPRVAILLGNQSRWLLAACAVFRVGAVLVPVDYKLSASEQLDILAHADADLLVTDGPLLKRLDDAMAKGASRFDQPVLLVEGSSSAASVTALDALPPCEMPPLHPSARTDVASIVYSSGTGGRAKGCLLSHGAYLAQLHALMELFPMRPGHRSFSVLPTNHAIDFMVGFLGPFACGATVVHQRTLRPEFLVSTMEEHRISHLALVPVLLEAFERSLDEKLDKRPAWQRSAVDALSTLNRFLTRDAVRPDLSRALLPGIHDAFGGSLELMFAGGAFVDRARAERFHALGLPVAIGYGLTECCTVASVNDLRPFRADSVGRPVLGVEVRIEAAEADGVGEVWIRGETLMRGYLGDAELTAETLTHDGWLRTGDLGWLDASRHLHLVGRAKNMIVTAGGKNVYPEDVESAFAGIDGVDELAVFASGYVWPRRAHLTAEGLFVVVRGRIAPAALRSELEARNRKLAEHKRVSAFVVVEDSFPRTASMKIKREPLALRLRERVEPGDASWHALKHAESSATATL